MTTIENGTLSIFRCETETTNGTSGGGTSVFLETGHDARVITEVSDVLIPSLTVSFVVSCFVIFVYHKVPGTSRPPLASRATRAERPRPRKDTHVRTSLSLARRPPQASGVIRTC